MEWLAIILAFLAILFLGAFGMILITGKLLEWIAGVLERAADKIEERNKS